MASLQDPTPCPAPRAGLRRAGPASSSILGHSLGGVEYAKPRRPRRGPSGVGWDPTVDIYQDTFELHKSILPDTNQCKKPALSPVIQDQIPAGPTTLPRAGASISNVQPRRRSSMFMQPAQKTQLESCRSEANLKRRRTNTLAQVDETTASSFAAVQPVHQDPIQLQSTTTTKTDDPNKLRLITKAPRRSSIYRSAAPLVENDTLHIQHPVEQISVETKRDIGKEPRRKTIYMSSEDAGTFAAKKSENTAYLGDASPRKPRRSDVFLDLAQAAAVTGSRETLARTKSSRSSRMSLSTAPRRAPLQSSARQLQASMYAYDRAGSGGGKENIPPGMHVKSDKTCTPIDVTIDIDLSSMYASRPSPLFVVQEEEKASSDAVEEVLQPRRQSSVASITATKSAVNRPPRLSTALIPRNTPAEVPEKRSTIASSRLSLVGRQSLAPQVRYPVLTENISAPALFEEKWLSHQETAITQLINHLIDKSSSQILRGQDRPNSSDELRQFILTAYQEPAQVLLHKRLQASIRFGGLSLPKATLAQVGRFRDDLAQRQRFLDLWLKTYDLSYLQIAAEAIIGRRIVVTGESMTSPAKTIESRSQARHVEAFLKTFLVNNSDGLRSAADGRASARLEGQQLDDEDPELGSSAWHWRRTVLRSLMLLLMLDKAKVGGSLKGCLFQKSSPFKSSTAVLQAFSMLLMPTVGDASRVLSHLNYFLSHTQLPLQEYDYHINNLAMDLRDGIVLTRLAEALLNDSASKTVSVEQSDSTVDIGITDTALEKPTVAYSAQKTISQNLKIPAISRVQKVHNVEVGLAGLRELQTGGVLLDGLSAEDIVDGHREKTVGLLWGLLCRWGLRCLLDLNLVKAETRRLGRALKSKQICETPSEMESSSDENKLGAAHDESVEQYTQSLELWAQGACLLHGVHVTNLSTSFADGKAYQAILKEYSQYLGSDANGSADNGTSLVETLTRTHCSRAFVDLFKSTGSIPTAETTVPQLAFLACRLLPMAWPCIAASTIQRAWRAHKHRQVVHRRVRLAVLAHEAAVVVGVRERILGAALTIQRAWRKYEYGRH